MDITGIIESQLRAGAQPADIRASLVEALARVSGNGVRIWSGHAGDLAEAPAGGAILHVRWAIADQSYSEWYPSVQAARLALQAVATSSGRVPEDDGLRVDLTAPGCHPSDAWVEVRPTDGDAEVDPMAEGELDFGYTSVLVLRSRPGGGYDAALVDRETGAERPVALRPSDSRGWLHVSYRDEWGDVRGNACVWITKDEPLPGTPAWGEWFRSQTPGCECHHEPHARHCVPHGGPRDGRCSCLGCVPSPVEAAP